MDLKELVAFQTIVQEKTFSRAAEKLNYAQSTITNQIQRLEKELGIQLFKRGWDVQLTPAGQIFAAEVDHLIRHWNDTAELARSLQQEQIGTLRIGGIESAIHRIMPNAMRQLQQDRPRMTCEITTSSTDRLVEELWSDRLDFAICGCPADASAFYFDPLYEEKTILVADHNHPLCQSGSASFNDVLGYPLIAGGPTCLYHLQFSRYLSRYQTSPSLMHSVTPISLIPPMVKHTSAIGVVLESTPLLSGIQQIDVELELSFIPVGILQLRQAHYSKQSPANLLQEIIKEHIKG
ncbi:LysR family transcriptional regulator [Paenibacillus bovis]|uniref:Transcriptional regulator n=1 Tax=Paenibacillus bovis TaxID=1616788 RepID=A0A172ZCL2_9BACL|nr:LysR family transcriptional regulator [Paenibacillus bovis]ANF95007.1 transcriptional regulator [Paenibacillus bovis]